MELILKTDNESSLAKIIALAKSLNVSIEQRNNGIRNAAERDELIKRILNHKTSEPSSFGDPAEWERQEREDRDLPFSE